MIDLELAEFAATRFPDKVRGRPIFRRPRLRAYAESRTGLDVIAKQMRESTWRRHESHEKQLKHFLDRERYRQNQTWQAEYDRLASVPAPGLQPYVDARLGALKDLLRI